jgi:hypothetical protein
MTRGGRYTGACVALLLALTLVAPSTRAGGSGRFAIKNAYTVLRDGVYYLNADLRLLLDPKAATALNSGVPLVVKLKIEVTRRRAILWDPTIAEITESWRVTYHALSRRYVVQSLNSGRQESYRRISRAFSHIGHVAGVPVIDASLLKADETYDISIQAAMNVKIIPTGFGLLTSVFYGADQSTDWREWRLK